MKKNIRILTLLLSLALICSVFTGCNFIDEMRQSQGFKYEDSSIEFNSNKYLPLTGSAINVTYTFDPFMVLDKQIFITQPDVPVLLSAILCDEFGYISTDMAIIALYDNDYNATYYCREDKHEEMLQRINEPFVPAVLAYYYELYDSDIDDYTSESYILTEEQKKAVEDVITSITPKQIEDNYYYDTDYYCDIYECSEDLLFNSYALTIEYMNGQYAVFKNTADGITEVYTVPDELRGIFSEIMEKYMIAYELYAELDAGAV